MFVNYTGVRLFFGKAGNIDRVCDFVGRFNMERLPDADGQSDVAMTRGHRRVGVIVGMVIMGIGPRNRRHPCPRSSGPSGLDHPTVLPLREEVLSASRSVHPPNRETRLAKHLQFRAECPRRRTPFGVGGNYLEGDRSITLLDVDSNLITMYWFSVGTDAPAPHLN